MNTLKLHLLLGPAVLVGLHAPAVVSAQAVMRLFPSCATPDSTFIVETNLWPRVYHQRVIRRIYLDWTSPLSTPIFAVNEPTWKPTWSETLQVPTGTAAGSHSIRVEQLEQLDPEFGSGFIRTGCVVAPFNVALSTGDPWSATHDTTISASYRDASNNVGKVFVFDPSVACDITACEAIRLIQVHQDLAVIADFLTTLLPATGRYLDGVRVTPRGRTVVSWSTPGDQFRE